MDLSIILPIKNEAENIKSLYEELKNVLNPLKIDYEIICVNDGSSDNSLKFLKELATQDLKVKIIDFKTNFGQTAAMSAGIKNAQGEIIMPMDSDLQNDPADIPNFITKINEGYDVVSGWRKNRKDKMLSRKIPSWIANWLLGIITKVKIHDYGCSIKAYRRDMIKEVNLYGEMHRFIPAYIYWQGGKVTEIVVNHRPRIHGKTNYNIYRTFRVILDLVVLRFLFKYINRPMHFFGGIGFASFFIGIIFGLTAVIFKVMHIRDFVATPLPIFSALFTIVGVQLIAMGIIAEMLMRTYYETQKKDPYVIREKINL